jgi:hypothetical protein
MAPWVGKLKKVVFPANGRWEKEDKRVYSKMKGILQQAQKDPKVLSE